MNPAPNDNNQSFLTTQNLGNLIFAEFTRDHDLSEMKNIRQWNVKRLSFSQNIREGILKRIQHIRFSKLNFLSLDHNNIVSIERIAHISMPELRFLRLDRNKIGSIKELRKMQTQNIRHLWLSYNHIKDEEKLTEASFESRDRIFSIFAYDSYSQMFDLRPFIKIDKRVTSFTFGFNKSKLRFHPHLLPIMKAKNLN